MSTNCTAAQDVTFDVRVPGLRKWETDSNITGNINNAMKEFAEVEGQVRSTEETDTCNSAEGWHHTRAAAPCLLIKITRGAVNDQKPVITFDDHFDAGFRF